MANQTDNSAVQEALNHQVANFTVLWTKLHNFHWYVKGPQFFSLHEKFEELYTQSATYVDELAERLLAIGGEPVGRLDEALKEACIEEASYNLTAEEMVKELTQDFDKISQELNEGKVVAEEADDDRTGDIFIGMTTELDKHNWMLKSFLGREV